MHLWKFDWFQTWFQQRKQRWKDVTVSTKVLCARGLHFGTKIIPQYSIKKCCSYPSISIFTDQHPFCNLKEEKSVTYNWIIHVTLHDFYRTTFFNKSNCTRCALLRDMENLFRVLYTSVSQKHSYWELVKRVAKYGWGIGISI